MKVLLDPHTAIFTGMTGCGKTERALRLIEKEYMHHFDFIVIACTTLEYNKTYISRRWFLNDPYVIAIDPKDHLFEWIEKLSKMLANFKTLFILDDVIALKCLDQRRQPLLELSISGRHRRHSLWILTQSYTAVQKDIRRQVKMLYVWYPKDRKDMNVIYEENDVIETQEELQHVRKKLKEGKHACLMMRLEHPRAYEVC